MRVMKTTLQIGACVAVIALGLYVRANRESQVIGDQSTQSASKNASESGSHRASDGEAESLLKPTPRHLRLRPVHAANGDASPVVRELPADANQFSAVSWTMPWSNAPQQPAHLPSPQPIPDPAYSPSSMPPAAMTQGDLHWTPLTQSSVDAYLPDYGCSTGNCGQLGERDLGGPWREPSAGRYRIRGGDTLRFTFQQTREQLPSSYRLAFGDQVRVTSDTHPELNSNEPIEVMPDGTISIPGLQSIDVAELTLAEARLLLEEKLVTEANYNSPRITLLSVRAYQRLNDLLAAVSSQFQQGGQNVELTVVRDGTIALPMIGSICVVGLTREELAAEVNARYAQVVHGIEVTVNISQTSPAFVYVMGQVAQPGRLEARLPMTVWQAIAQAGGHLQGAKMDNVVILRRTEDWRLVATCIDLSSANRARPTDFPDIFLWDSDVILVPKARIQRTDELIQLYLTQGLYAMFPSQLQIDQNSVF